MWGGSLRLLLEEKLSAKLTDEVRRNIVRFLLHYRRIRKFHLIRPFGAPSPQGEGFYHIT